MYFHQSFIIFNTFKEMYELYNFIQYQALIKIEY